MTTYDALWHDSVSKMLLSNVYFMHYAGCSVLCPSARASRVDQRVAGGPVDVVRIGHRDYTGDLQEIVIQVHEE